MKLSEDFLLEEFTATSTELPNEPDDVAEEKLLYLANYILQPIRDRWRALRITSGYRSPAVNARIGGSSTSQHLKGEAADFQPLEADIKDVYRWIVEDSRINYGQCIFERKGHIWIHVGLIRMNKPYSESLVYDGKSYQPYRGVL